MLFNEKRIIFFIFLLYLIKLTIIRPSVIEGLILMTLFIILSLNEFFINRKRLEIEERNINAKDLELEKIQLKLSEQENKINNLQSRISLSSIKKSN